MEVDVQRKIITTTANFLGQVWLRFFGRFWQEPLDGSQSGKLLKPGLSPLKWATMIVPAAVLIAFDYLRHSVPPFSFFHGWTGLLIVWGLVLAGVGVFSHTVFVIIDKSQQEVRRRNRELAATADTATALGQSLNLKEILNVALEKVLEILDVRTGTVCVLDEAARELVHVAHRGMPPQLLGPLNRAKLERDPVGTRVVETGKPTVVNDLWEDPRVAEAAKRVGIRAVVSVPLKADGKVVGVMALASSEARCFTPSEVAVLTSVGSQLGMAVQNAVLFEDLLRRNQELAVINSISAAVSSSLDLTEVMVTTVDRIVGLVGAEAGEVWLQETDGELVLAVHRGLFPDSFYEIDRFSVGQGFPGVVAQTGDPIVAHDLVNEGRYLRQSVKDKGFQSMACFPLKSRGRVVGTISIASRQKVELSARDLQLLDSVGGQIGVAIENATLHQQVHDLAVLEERDRIAREMHDGVGQILGYVNTKTQAAKRLLTLGQLDQAEQALGQLEEAARDVYADVREAIVGLRTSTEGRGFVAALREYMGWFARQNMIQTELTVEETWDGSLETRVEIQVIRILQEALSNVRKHSKAVRVSVHISTTGADISLVVRDNGLGFLPERVVRGTWPQFGLQTMRERAESVGGTFEVTSGPGKGTVVRVLVPRGNTKNE